MKDPGRALLEIVVKQLDEVADQLVFIGGSTIGLHLTEPQIVSVRPTEDVDTVVQVANLSELEVLRASLHKKGFSENPEEKVICRFVSGELTLDVMPDDFAIYGFTNRWYKPGLANAINFHLSARKIKIFSTIYLVATKMEAFNGRGKGDFLASHDIEDLVNLFDGRAELGNEIRRDASPVADWVRMQLMDWTSKTNFRQAIEGHVTDRQNSAGRRDVILERMRASFT